MAIHKKKALLITGGVITLAVLTGILALMLNINAFTPQIEAAMSMALGMEVRITGSSGLAVFPGFGLTLKNVVLRKNGVDVVKIEKMRMRLKLRSLARSEIKIIQVRLVRPVFSIVRSKNGMFNVEKPERRLWEQLLAVEKLTILQGNLFYTNEASGETIEVGELDVNMNNLYFDGTNHAGPFKNSSFTGNVGCKILRITDLTLTNISMSAAAEKGILDVNPIRMNISGGDGNGSLHVDMTGALPRYRFICSLNRVRIEDLVHLYAIEKSPQKTIEGAIDISADLTAIGKHADEMKRSLDGILALNGQDLMIYDFDIDDLVMKYERSQNFNLLDVGAFLLAGPFGPIVTKSYNFASLYEASQGGKGRIRKLVSVWKVENGIAEARDVALASKEQRIAMRGGLDFIRERFVDVTIAALDKRGCTVFSENVRGPFNKPTIEKENILKSIAGSVLNPLQDAWEFIQGQECTVFYSGSVAQPEG